MLRIRLKPKSARDEVDGLIPSPEGAVISARVRALPHANAANEALERLVAEWLRVPRTTVSLDSGGRGRLKTIRVAGDVADLEQRVRERLSKLDSFEGHS